MAENDPIPPAGYIDPDIREFARRLNDAYATHGEAANVTERRRIAESVRETWRAGGKWRKPAT